CQQRAPRKYARWAARAATVTTKPGAGSQYPLPWFVQGCRRPFAGSALGQELPQIDQCGIGATDVGRHGERVVGEQPETAAVENQRRGERALGRLQFTDDLPQADQGVLVA